MATKETTKKNSVSKTNKTTAIEAVKPNRYLTVKPNRYLTEFSCTHTKGLTQDEKSVLNQHFRFQDTKFFNDKGIHHVGSLGLIRRLQNNPTTITLVLNKTMLTELSVIALSKGLTIDEFIRVTLADQLK